MFPAFSYPATSSLSSFSLSDIIINVSTFTTRSSSFLDVSGKLVSDLQNFDEPIDFVHLWHFAARVCSSGSASQVDVPPAHAHQVPHIAK